MTAVFQVVWIMKENLQKEEVTIAPMSTDQNVFKKCQIRNLFSVFRFYPVITAANFLDVQMVVNNNK